MSAKFWSPLIPLLFLLSIVRAADPSPAPSRFSAHIGGFLGSSHSVELKDGTLTCMTYGPGRSSPKKSTVMPTPAQWQEFRRELDEIKVWQWNDLYFNRNVLDGTQWALDIVYADHSIKAGGSNSYPDASGKTNNDPTPTKAFNRYLAAIDKLTGGMGFK